LIEAGIQRGDRVAILSNTREEWVVADLAILMTGAISVPIYPTLNAEEMAFVIDDSGAKALLAEGPQHIEKLAQPELAASLRKLLFAYIFDCQSLRDIPTHSMPRPLTCDEAAKMTPVPVHTLADAIAAGERLLDSPEKARTLELRIEQLSTEDIASLLYTAGASGRPKGVMLTHGNFCFEARSAREGLRCTGQDEQLLFLPLAHIMGRLLVVIQMEIGGVTIFAESMLRAIDNAAEVNPTFFGTVPRFFEKFYSVVERKAGEEGRVKARLYHWAIDVGRRAAELRRQSIAPGLGLMLEHHYADKLILSKLRSRFGSRLRFIISGGAPLSKEVAEWFEAIGVTILEGYGLTETTGACNFNRPNSHQFGTVGPALPGVENAIGTGGEILIRGPNIMKGYWKDEGATADAIDSDGYFHTGDIGHLDSQSALTITDRRQDLIASSNGKTIAPQSIENRIKQSP
jgi:long-chain acyl-CoA synthetase